MRHLLLLSIALSFSPEIASGKTAADGTDKGPNVTVTDNGDDTVTMANGIASIVIVKTTRRLNSVTYTYDNDGTPKTSQTLSGKACGANSPERD